MSIHDTTATRLESFSSVQAAAILGCARTTLILRMKRGEVPGWRTSDGKWMLDAEGLAVAKTLIRPTAGPLQNCKTCPQLGELLQRWGTGTSAEAAPVMGIHEGNVRKHFGHLSRKGFAIRRLDGPWELTEAGASWITAHLADSFPTDFAKELDREVSTGT